MRRWSHTRSRPSCSQRTTSGTGSANVTNRLRGVRSTLRSGAQEVWWHQVSSPSAAVRPG
jgi:hypothetical protein